ncbi:MAG: sortase [Candidatus Heteroscillospira sp.]|jgi:LPXTG-site transpeptidase (sortase) family protein
MKGRKIWLLLALVCLAMALLLFLCVYLPQISTPEDELEYRPKPTEIISAEDPTPGSTPPATTEPEASPDMVDGLPVGKLIATRERAEYTLPELMLRIPALGVKYGVYDGTSSQELRYGVGLYDYAQMPGDGNRNTSIAGHRNSVVNGKVTDAAPFYYIDTLGEGDYIYLTDDDHIYRYVWQECYVVEADDWSPIYTTGYSCITLTSCHPIGISDHRIIVRGLLDAILENDGNYDYPADLEELSENEEK